MRGTKGITLIALVITITILLIIAGITMNMILGEDNIIKKAGDAKNIQKSKTREEEKELYKAEIIADSYKKGKPTYLKVGDSGEIVKGGKAIEGVSINNGVLTSEFTKTGSKLGAALDGTVILPEGITEIAPATFGIGKKIKNIIIQEGVTSIGQEAFFECAELENIVFPETLLNISTYSFMYCGKLKKLVLPSKLKTIGGYAFSATNIKEKLVIPASVSSIGYRAFYKTGNLEKVVILCDGVDDLTEKSPNYPWGLNESIIDFVENK